MPISTLPRQLHRFDSLIVVHDLIGVTDRALPIIGWLARRGDLGVRLVTTTSPARDVNVDPEDLETRARRIDGCLVMSIVLESTEPAQELAEFADRHTGALICVATHGRTTVGGPASAGNADDWLHLHSGPVLMVGPSVGYDGAPGDSLLVAVDASCASSSLEEAANAWRATFGATLDFFGGAGNAPDPVAATLDAARSSHSVIAVTGHPHTEVEGSIAGSIAAELVRRSPTPVLVVPG